ncbi:MAG: SpoIIE family protein phosphatase [Oscillospiraceae bacterium]|nr:SpoIIE family protein phosphatase [Oscillospiraceae bacterium]
MKRFQSVAFKSIIAIVVPLLLFAVVVGFAGNQAFTEALQEQYAADAFHIADTAAQEIDADQMEQYLKSGGKTEAYRAVWERLDRLCNTSDATFIYVIQPDLADYGHIRFVFSTVNSRFSEYSPYEAGFVRETTNDEYREQYRSLYEGRSETELQYLVNGQYTKEEYHLTAMQALKGADGATKGIVCVQRQLSSLEPIIHPFHRSILRVLLVIVLLVVLGQSIYMHRVLIRPVRRISEEAKRFAAENRQSSVKLSDQIRTRDEIGLLADSIDQMEEQVADYIDNLTVITAEKERITTELSLAKRIQEAMLPHIFPPFPERKEFDLYASMTPAKEIGGDFYDFFLIDEDHLGLVMADVSGKGIPAALFMMICKTILQSCAMLGQSPAEILTKTNEAICSNNQVDMFVTVWIGILEISTGKLRAANAGHEYPVLKRAGGSFELFKDRHGLVVGAMSGVKYREYELQLEPGDELFVYTDGVPEAIDAENHAFGTQRMVSALNLEPDAGPEALLHHVQRELDAFVNGADQFDDITMLGFVYHGMEGQTMQKSITMDAALSNLDQALAFVDAALESLECPVKLQTQVDLAVEEAFVNVANYAYGAGTGPVTLSTLAEKDAGTLTVTLTDSGAPFNPLERKDPDLTLPAEEREIGGLGILMVKKSMDHVSYEYKNGQNILTMRKTIQA